MVKLNCIKRVRNLKHKIGREKAFQKKMGRDKELNGVKARSFYSGLCRRIWSSKKELASDLKLGHIQEEAEEKARKSNNVDFNVIRKSTVLL